MPKLPDYEERTADIAQEGSELDQRLIEEVSSIIRSGLKASAQVIINLTTFEGKDSVDVQSANVRFNAAKHHLKLGGMEVDRTEHSGKVEGIQIYLPEVSK